MSILKKVLGLSVVGCALTLGAAADARIAVNDSATNRIATNRIATNRIATNRIATNRIATNRIATNRIATNRIAVNGLTSGVVAGEGAFSDVSSIQLADGTQLSR